MPLLFTLSVIGLLMRKDNDNDGRQAGFGFRPTLQCRVGVLGAKPLVCLRLPALANP